MSDPAFTHVQVRLHPHEVELLDAYRASQKVPPSRQCSAQQLVRRALRELLWSQEAYARDA
jgi:hypothetical protein